MLAVWQLDINERLQKTMMITNSSQFDIDFAWELKSDGGAVTIGPMSGRLERGQSEQCHLTFTSQRPVILKHCQLVLRVSRFLFSPHCIVMPKGLYFTAVVFRSTPPSRPNNICLKCPSVRTSVRPPVRSQKVSSISTKFGM